MLALCSLQLEGPLKKAAGKVEDGVSHLQGGFCPFCDHLCRAVLQKLDLHISCVCFEHQRYGRDSLKCRPCCAEKVQDVKEAAKKPGEHRRGWTISAAVAAVAIGIYLVSPAQSL